MENIKGDLKICGSGSAGGGVYNDVKISGSGDVNGDIDCNMIKISGSGSIHGSVKANLIKTSGSSKIEGSVNAEDIILNGSGNIGKSVKCKTLKILGSGNIGSNVYAHEVNILGSGDIDGNCEAEIFNVKGSFAIDGLLNVGKINIELKGKCRVKEIGGEHIEVRKSNSMGIEELIKIFINQKWQLISDVIEGDDIYLEYTTADIVRGKNVCIGPGCKIDKIEYTNKIDISKESKVGDKIKLG